MRLDDIVRGVHSRGDSEYAFLDLDSGKLLLFSRSELEMAEGEVMEDDLPHAHREKVARIRDYLGDPERFLSLPDTEELDERTIMEEFCDTVENADMQREMLRALRGKAPSRRFHEVVSGLKLGLEWESYRLEALSELVQEWCEEHGIEIAPSSSS